MMWRGLRPGSTASRRFQARRPRAGRSWRRARPPRCGAARACRRARRRRIRRQPRRSRCRSCGPRWQSCAREGTRAAAAPAINGTASCRQIARCDVVRDRICEWSARRPDDRPRQRRREHARDRDVDGDIDDGRHIQRPADPVSFQRRINQEEDPGNQDVLPDVGGERPHRHRHPGADERDRLGGDQRRKQATRPSAAHEIQPFEQHPRDGYACRRAPSRSSRARGPPAPADGRRPVRDRR